MSPQAETKSFPSAAVAAGVFGLLLLAYALAGFLLLPWYAKRELPRFAEERLQHRARVGEVAFNPFTLTLRATDFALEDQAGRAVLAFGEASLAVEWRSLLRGAWLISELRLLNPSLRVGIAQDGEVNLAVLAARAGGASGAAAEPARFAVRHVALVNGSVDFEDLRSGYNGGLRRLSFELSPLSTLDPGKGPYALVADTPNGGKLRWKGELSLQPLIAAGKLELENASLPELTAYLDDYAAARIVSGRADLDLPYRFAFTEGRPGLVLEGAKLALRDVAIGAVALAEAPFAKFSLLSLEGVTLDTLARHASAQALRLADVALVARRDARGELDLARMFAPNLVRVPAATQPAAWSTDIAAVELANVSTRYVDETSKKPLHLRQRGLSAKLKLRLESGEGGMRARMDMGELAIAALQAGGAEPEAPAVVLEDVSLTGMRFDSHSNSFEAAGLRAAKFSVDAAMHGERLSLLDLLPAPGAASDKPLAASVKAVELGEGRVSFADRGRDIALALERVSAKLGNVSTDMGKAFSFELAAGVRGGGRIAARGRAVPGSGTAGTGRKEGTFEAQVRVEASGLPLAPLQPYLDRYASVKLTSGEASLAGNLRMGGTRSSDAAAPTLSFSGAAAASGVAIDDTSGVRLIGWKSLATDTLRLSLSPDRAEIDEMRWTAPSGRLAIATDGTTNLSRAFARKDAASTPVVVPAASAAQNDQQSAPESGTLAVVVRRVRIEQGQLDFSDDSLRPPFAAKIHELAGTLNGISSDRSTRSQFALDGRVDEFGSARLSGTLNPFAWRDSTNIAMQFRNIDLAAVSPYSVKFAGYRIASGRMALDLNYRVRGSALEGDNKMTLDNFILGEKVESAGALDLPIALAVALLKDADGRIDIAVPVTGNIDDPQFSYGAVVWKALGNLVGNIVAAPFRALARIFGGEAADTTGVIAFDPGSSRLLPPQREKLGRIVEGLGKRPELKLGIPARYDSEADAAALRRVALAREVGRRTGLTAGDDEDPGPLSVDDRPTRAALRALFAERFPAAEWDKLKAEAEARENERERETPAAGGKPPALSILDRARNLATGEPQLADARGFYLSLSRRLRDAQPLPANALADLAQQRAAAIAGALQAAGVDPERLSRSTAPPLAHAEAKEVTVELSLGVITSTPLPP